jgi:hypothetical protein
MDRAYYSIDGVKYVKAGWLGCQLKSTEFGVKQSDVRVIAGCLMYAYRTDRKWYGAKEVSWCLVAVGPATLDEANKLIKELYEKLPK